MLFRMVRDYRTFAPLWQVSQWGTRREGLGFEDSNGGMCVGMCVLQELLLLEDTLQNFHFVNSSL